MGRFGQDMPDRSRAGTCLRAALAAMLALPLARVLRAPGRRPPPMMRRFWPGWSAGRGHRFYRGGDFGGQMIHVVPSFSLTIVMTSDTDRRPGRTAMSTTRMPCSETGSFPFSDRPLPLFRGVADVRRREGTPFGTVPGPGLALPGGRFLPIVGGLCPNPAERKA